MPGTSTKNWLSYILYRILDTTHQATKTMSQARHIGRVTALGEHLQADNGPRPSSRCRYLETRYENDTSICDDEKRGTNGLDSVQSRSFRSRRILYGFNDVD